MLTFLILAFIQSISSQYYGYDDYEVCRECKDCVKCESVVETYEGLTVHLKYDPNCGDSVSWGCCRSSVDEDGTEGCCELNDCNSLFDEDKDFDTNACSYVSKLSYNLPAEAAYLTVQIADIDFNGNKDCGYYGEDCCYDTYTSCTSASSGVCEVVIDINACRPTIIPPPECETTEDCYLEDDAPCSERVCSYGECVSVTSGNHKVCREANPDAPCDVEERCDGFNTACPEDEKADYYTVCREAKSACDYEETCDGVHDECPPDTWHNEEFLCREAQDGCDVPEYCTGASGDCPPDTGYDYAYTFKCSTTQYLCGISRDDLSLGNGGGYFSGSCGIGTANNFIDLPYPECLDDDLHAKCPNNRGLSNWSESNCDPYTGNWECYKKAEVSGGTSLPYKFPWN